jgi:hypothetical protein
MTKASCESSQEDWYFLVIFSWSLFGPCYLVLLWILFLVS